VWLGTGDADRDTGVDTKPQQKSRVHDICPAGIGSDTACFRAVMMSCAAMLYTSGCRGSPDGGRRRGCSLPRGARRVPHAYLRKCVGPQQRCKLLYVAHDKSCCVARTQDRFHCWIIPKHFQCLQSLQHGVLGQPLLHYPDNATLLMRAARDAGRARQGLELAFTHVGRTSIDGQDVVYVFKTRLGLSPA
jgi:hypothetical protein